MRILFLSQLVPFPLDAGPKVRSYHVLQHLVTSGHDVTLLAFRRSTDRPEDLAHLESLCAAVHTVPMVRSRIKDAWHVGRSLFTGTPALIARDHVPAMQRVLQALLRDQRFDAIHADQLWMAQYALAARSFLNGQGAETRLILDQHNAVYLVPRRLAADTKNPLKRLLLEREARVMKRYELETCGEFDRVVWVTEEDRRALEDAGGQAAAGTTIPICVDTEVKSAVTRAAQPRRVTFLGGLHWPPNAAGALWFAREVWPKVHDAVPEALFTVIGKSPPDLLRRDETAIPNLDVTGYVDEVQPYLADTAVFIVPLHAGGGMRVKIIDAWAWGLPIVSTTIGAEGVAYRHGDNLLIGDDPDAFAAAVISLLRSEELAERIGRRGRETAETRYEWRRIYQDWKNVYEQ